MENQQMKQKESNLIGTVIAVIIAIAFVVAVIFIVKKQILFAFWTACIAIGLCAGINEIYLFHRLFNDVHAIRKHLDDKNKN